LVDREPDTASGPRWRRPPSTAAELIRPVPRAADDVEVETIAEGLWCLRLPLPYPRPTSVNAFVLDRADGVCLVDCGTSLDPGWDALELGLGRLVRRPQDVVTLVCTHTHPDHAGLAATVVRRTACELLWAAVPYDGNDALRDVGIPLDVRRRAALAEGVPAERVRDFVAANVAGEGGHERPRPSATLAEGDALHTVSGTWRVVPIPGHSATQLGLFEPRRRWLISADLAYAAGRPFVEWGHGKDPYAEHLASLDRALALEPAMLLPGHGRVAASAGEARRRLTWSRHATRALLAQTRAALCAGGRSAYEVALALVDGDDDLDGLQSALSVALCILEHLQARGEVTARRGADGVRRFIGSAG
jgi:glyoxylase-like metal-dependent hydrolase (beta-lactamase superfamily II)